MRVVVYPADQGGCGCYRLIWPSEALIAAGYDVRLVMPNEPKEEQLQARWATDLLTGEDHVLDVIPPDADVVVMQRPLYAKQVTGIKSLQKQGVRVVVEIDDDFQTVPADNPAFRQTHPKLSPERNRNHLMDACNAADLVTVTTPALARRYGSHGRVKILPNRVPAWYTVHTTAPALVHNVPVVGWSGSVATHGSDLEVTRGGVARAVERASATFAVVGTGVDVGRRLGIKGTIPASGWLPINRYPEAMAMLSVGIVPLRSNQFNDAKSWLKGLEFLSLGVPIVASPTTEYRRLNMLMKGDGIILATGAADWEQAIIRLLKNGNGDRDRAAEARARIADRWTIESQAHEWWHAWTSMLERRRTA